MQSQPIVNGSRVGCAAALTVAGLAAMLASTCCVLPLLLAVVGITGAWISQLRTLQPYSTALMLLAFVALGLSAWRLFGTGPQDDQACQTGLQGGAPGTGDAACRQRTSSARRWFWLVALLTLVPLLVPLAAPWFY